MQQACTAFPEPRSARLRFPDTVDISNHVENVLLVEHDPQTQEFVAPWGACTPPDRAAVDLLPYAHTHRNHPCAVWTRATRANFDSTIELAQALAVEFRHRFGKPHGSEAVPNGPLQPFVLAMPEEYAVIERIRLPVTGQLAHVLAYRAYYRTEKRGYWRQPRDPAKPSVWVPAKWTKRDPPEWF
jgi:hypothetical protein